MKSLTAPLVPWSIVWAVLLFALGGVPGECAVRKSAPAAQMQAPVRERVAALPADPDCPASPPLPVNAPYCRHRVRPGQTLGSLAKHYGTTQSAIIQANQEPRTAEHKRLTSANLLRAGDRILIPTPSHAPDPPTPEETIVPVPNPPAVQPVSPPVSDAPPPAPATPAQAPPPSPQPEPLPSLSLARLVALASGGAVALVLIGFVFVRAGVSRSPDLLPPPPAAGHETGQLPIVPERVPVATRGAVRPLTDIHTVIQYLSTPKKEDCLLTASNERMHFEVLTDGASCSHYGGKELSGGGGAAARIAANAALTYLLDQSPLCVAPEEMLARLEGCFAATNTALFTHNSQAPIPGATTLIVAALWQAGDGRWYWLFGNIGNGVLSLIHTTQLLAGWPVETSLLTKQANGLRTITLSGNESQAFQPSVGLRPHRAGDLLLMGSDGLTHLDAVTRACDKLTFSNYLWREIRNDLTRVETTLASLRESRQDASWRHALALDDTTVGLIWAEEQER